MFELKYIKVWWKKIRDIVELEHHDVNVMRENEHMENMQKAANQTIVIACWFLCIFAGLILTHVFLQTVIRIVRSGGVGNDSQYEGQWYEHMIHRKEDWNIKELCEGVTQE